MQARRRLSPTTLAATLLLGGLVVVAIGQAGFSSTLSLKGLASTGTVSVAWSAPSGQNLLAGAETGTKTACSAGVGAGGHDLVLGMQNARKGSQCVFGGVITNVGTLNARLASYDLAQVPPGFTFEVISGAPVGAVLKPGAGQPNSQAFTFRLTVNEKPREGDTYRFTVRQVWQQESA